MRVHKLFARMLALSGALLLSLTAAVASASAAPAASSPAATYIVVSDPSSNTVNANLINTHGGHVVRDLSQAGVFVVTSQNPSALSSLPGVTGIARDARMSLVPDEGVSIQQSDTLAANLKQSSSQGCASTKASCPLQWDLARIHVPEAWKTTQGSSKVKVAVLDTGVTSTHEEVGSNYDIAESKSFVQPNDSCPADATTYNSIEDFQGHGTWTSLHIAGKNGTLMTGIAPKTTLVNVRVLGACGSGADSWILNGMLYANQVGASVISMSLGGYACGLGVIPGSHYCDNATDVADGPTIYKAYRQVINYLLAHGTVVVAAAGNDHVRINFQGLVTNHGTLAASGSPVSDPSNDYYGLTELPGGIPGVVTVSAVNRVTPAAAAGETLYGQVGVGRSDQLTYYSSYGEAVDVSAPGGARNYNVPRFDCAATAPNCARLDPSTDTSTDNPGDFGAWGVDAAGNPCNNCYANIQGTSMATPQVAGVAALLLASHPHLPAAALTVLLRLSVTHFSAPNATPAIETDSTAPTYLYDLDYDGRAIPNFLMGTGVIDAALAVRCG